MGSFMHRAVPGLNRDHDPVPVIDPGHLFAKPNISPPGGYLATDALPKLPGTEPRIDKAGY